MSAAAPPAPQLPDKMLAQALTEHLIEMVRLRSDLTMGERPADYASVKTDIYTADVEGNVVNFAHQISSVKSLGHPFPCISAGEGDPIPVSIFPDVADWRYQPFKTDYSPSDYLRSIASIPGSVGPEIFLLGPKEATDFFQKRLVDFLTARFSARQSDISASPGLQFTVATNTHGLRVHYSPAYFFDPKNVLNSPTSPVTGWMQPGRYIFGAGPLGSPPQFDFTAEYDIPPQVHASLGI